MTYPTGVTVNGKNSIREKHCFCDLQIPDNEGIQVPASKHPVAGVVMPYPEVGECSQGPWNPQQKTVGSSFSQLVLLALTIRLVWPL